MSAVRGSDLRLADLGPTERAALDRLLREFSLRGWRDLDDAGQAVIDALTRRGGLASLRVAARAVPGDFLRRNHIRRADLELVLDGLSAPR